MKNGLKKLLSWVLVFVLGFAVNLFVSFGGTRAAERLFEMRFQPIGEVVIGGYLNTSNTAFNVNAYFPDFDELDETELTLDGASFAPNPIYGTPSPNPGEIGEVNFGSGTMNNTVLQTLMPEGTHTLSIHKTFKDATTENEGLTTVICDYTLPSGVLTSVATASLETGAGYLKIGDKLTFNLALVAPDDVSSVAVANSIYNGRNLVWKKATALPAETNFTSKYLVTKGDPDQIAPVQLKSVVLVDSAGNSSVPLSTADIARVIDASAPAVAIDSPEAGESYNTSSVTLDYLTSNVMDVITVAVDGVLVAPTPVSGDPIGPLADGPHAVAVGSTDLAGNLTTVTSNFTIDTIAPFISITSGPDGQKIEQGQTITFEGTTEANADVLLEVFSDPQTVRTTADANGVWRVEFNSGQLAIGSHEAYITATDEAENEFRLKVASFEVIAKPQAAVASSATTVAQAAQSQAIATDITPPVVAACSGSTCQLPKKEEEVAKAGNILSSESQRENGFNWSAWIMFLAILVLASALATAGYYGYGWVVAGSSADKIARAKVTPQAPPPVVAREKDKRTESKSDQDKPSSRTTRW